MAVREFMLDVHMVLWQESDEEIARSARSVRAIPGARLHMLPGRETCLDRCKGWSLGDAPYLMHIDPGDELLPGVVDVIAAMKRHDAVAGVGTERVEFEDGRQQWAPRDQFEALTKRSYLEYPGVLHNAVVFQRSFVAANMPRVADWCWGQDWGMRCLAAEAVMVAVLEDTYRWVPTQGGVHQHRDIQAKRIEIKELIN